MKRLIIFLLSSLFFGQRASQFIYPVAHLGDTVFFIEQRASDDLLLWSWNRMENTFEPALASFYNPAFCTILPDKSGLSFIDNGRLRLKYWQKRSAKSLALDYLIEPIWNMRWLDEHTAYAQARRHGNSGIYQIKTDGTVDCLVGNGDVFNCGYPHAIDGYLFFMAEDACFVGDSFVERGVIICAPYPANDIAKEQSFFDQRTPLIPPSAWDIAVSATGNVPILWHMETAEKGFFFLMDKSVDKASETARFTYNQFYKRDGAWCRRTLFSFNLPACILARASLLRLYEFYRLMPYHVGEAIYFVDGDEEHCNIFCCAPDGTITQKTFGGTGEFLFAPYAVDEQTIIYGGAVSDTVALHKPLPSMVG